MIRIYFLRSNRYMDLDMTMEDFNGYYVRYLEYSNASLGWLGDLRINFGQIEAVLPYEKGSAPVLSPAR